MKADLSILIPARNEMFLGNTIDNILQNIEGNTELIVVCDGNWPHEPIQDRDNVQIIYHSQPIGQRAATNEAAKLSRAKFVMKIDAHCAVDKGIDVKMIAECKYDWTMIPRMYNLHAFNWRCKKCGNETYQGPTRTKCDKCDNTTEFERVILWKEKRNPTSDFFKFDHDLHFQYWGDFKKRPEAQPDIAPTMSLLGACWMMHRERYWELDGMDEEHGSWGQMGTEIACKSWLSGGALMVNKKTWFSHMFRTQGGDFGFPYSNPGVNQARKRSKELWLEGKWPKAKYDLSWLINRFAPVPDWDLTKLPTFAIKETKDENISVDNDRILVRDISKECVRQVDKKSEPEITPILPEKISKGIVFYTDNRLDEKIMDIVQKQIGESCNGYKIMSISLKPIGFGKNAILPLDRGYLTMFKQILVGLELSDADIIFFCEHDVLYHKSHFDFIPSMKDIYYYNQNNWQIRPSDGFAVRWDCKKTSQLCAYRELLINHYRERIRRVEKEGFSRRMGFEPGSHNRPERVDDFKSEGWTSEFPNLDLKYGKNLTEIRWNPSEFRSQRSCRNWKESTIEQIPGWEGVTLCHIPV